MADPQKRSLQSWGKSFKEKYPDKVSNKLSDYDAGLELLKLYPSYKPLVDWDNTSIELKKKSHSESISKKQEISSQDVSVDPELAAAPTSAQDVFNRNKFIKSEYKSKGVSQALTPNPDINLSDIDKEINSVNNDIKSAETKRKQRQSQELISPGIFNISRGIKPDIDIEEIEQLYNKKSALAVKKYQQTGQLKKMFDDMQGELFKQGTSPVEYYMSGSKQSDDLREMIKEKYQLDDRTADMVMNDFNINKKHAVLYDDFVKTNNTANLEREAEIKGIGSLSKDDAKLADIVKQIRTLNNTYTKTKDVKVAKQINDLEKQYAEITGDDEGGWIDFKTGYKAGNTQEAKDVNSRVVQYTEALESGQTDYDKLKELHKEYYGVYKHLRNKQKELYEQYDINNPARYTAPMQRTNPPDVKAIDGEIYNAKTNFEAISRVLYTNQLREDRTFGKELETLVKPAISAFAGEDIGNAVFGTSIADRTRALNTIITSNEKGIQVTDKDIEQLSTNEWEDFNEFAGGMIGVVGQFVVMDKMGGALGITKFINNIPKLSRFANYPTTAKLLQKTAQLAWEDAKFQMIGGEPGKGAIFTTTASALNKLPIGQKWGRLGKALFEYGKASVALEAASKVSEFVPIYTESILSDKDFEYELEKTFGSTNDALKYSAYNVLLGGMFGYDKVIKAYKADVLKETGKVPTNKEVVNKIEEQHKETIDRLNEEKTKPESEQKIDVEKVDELVKANEQLIEEVKKVPESETKIEPEIPKEEPLIDENITAGDIKTKETEISEQKADVVEPVKSKVEPARTKSEGVNEGVKSEIKADDYGKVLSASSRFRPKEKIVFDKPIVGKNGAELISYDWAYEWTETPDREGEMKPKRISDWTQAESNAETGRDVVHKFTVKRKDGTMVTVSSETIPSLLGYVDAKEMRNLPSIISSVKTLAKQKMKLAILEAQEKEYRELQDKYENSNKPEIIEIPEPVNFVGVKENWEKGEHKVFSMGDVWVRQQNKYDHYTGKYTPIEKPSKETIDALKSEWIEKRIKENGGKYPSGIYDLRRLIERQEKKVEQATNSKLKSEPKINEPQISDTDTKKSQVNDAVNLTDNTQSGIRSSFESNIESLVNPETGLGAVVSKIIEKSQPYKDAFLKRINISTDELIKLGDSEKQKIQDLWIKSPEFKELEQSKLSKESDINTQSGIKETKPAEVIPDKVENKGAEIDNPFMSTAKEIYDNEKDAGWKEKRVESFVYQSLSGDRNRDNRQTLMSQLTGKKVTKAESGVTNLYNEIIKNIKSQQPQTQPTNEIKKETETGTQKQVQTGKSTTTKTEKEKEVVADTELKDEKVIDGVKYTRQAENTPKIKGAKTNKIKFAQNASIDGDYALIEADNLQPSHIGNAENPMFFNVESQPKNRNTKSSLVAQEGIAQNPNFKELSEGNNAYFGAPIINERGEVIQGNNRAAGVKKHYQYGGTKYKSELTSNASKFGIKASDVEKMENPILVRVIKVSDKQAIEYGNYDVKDLETGGASRIDTIQVGKRMDSDAKRRLSDILFGNDQDLTIKQSIRDNSNKVINLLKNYLSDTQIESIYNKSTGEIKPEAIDDISKIVEGFMFEGKGASFIDMYNELPTTARQALNKSLTYVFGTKESNSILPEIQNAIEAIHEFRASGIEKFNEWLNQSSMFEKPPMEKYSSFEIDIADKFLKAKTQKEIQQFFAKYMLLSNGKEADMFEPEISGLSKEDAIKAMSYGKLDFDGNGNYNVGHFNNDKPAKSAPINPGATVNPIETPELVELLNEIKGSLRVRKLPNGKNGYYSPLTGITLDAKLFEAGNEVQLLKTLAHEIAHNVDNIPDVNMKRGNLLGSIYSLKNFLYAGFGKNKSWTKPELDQMRKDILEDILTDNRLTLDEWNDNFFGKKPKGTFTPISRATIKQITEDVNMRFDYWKKAEKILTNKEIKKELIEFSEYFRPYNKAQATDKYIKYRESSRELFADALGALLVDPYELSQRAPKFFDEFTKQMSRKPEFQKAYFDIQDAIRDPLRLPEHRYNVFIAGQEKTRQAWFDAMNKPRQSNWQKIRDGWNGFMSSFVTKNRAVYGKYKKGDTDFGLTLSPRQSIRNNLEYLKMLNNQVASFIDQTYSKVLTKVSDLGISAADWNMLFTLEANIGEYRKDKANPYLWDKEVTEKQMKWLREHKYSDEIIDEALKLKRDLHDIIFDNLEKMNDAGMFTPETWQTIQDNKYNYATYISSKYIKNDYIPAGIREVTGMIDPNAPAFEATMLKTVSQIAAYHYQKTKLEIKKMFENLGEFEEAEKVYTGDKSFAKFKPKDGKEVLGYYDNGVWKGFYVDKDVYNAVHNDIYMNKFMDAAVVPFRVFNSVFNPAVTKYNPGFALFVNILRDTPRTKANLYAIARALPTSKASNLLSDYFNARLGYWVGLPSAIKMASKIHKFQYEGYKGSDIVNEMIKYNAVDATHGLERIYSENANDFIEVATNRLKNKRHQDLIEKYSDKKHWYGLGIGKVLKTIGDIADITDKATKINGYRMLRDKYNVSPEAAAFYTRNYFGTPNYKDGGSFTRYTNSFLPFSNIATQALRNDAEIAFKKKTSASFWTYAAAGVMTNAFISAALYSGLVDKLFGTDHKKIRDKIPNYYKYNFNCIPIGTTKDGMAKCITIPLDERSRLIHAVSMMLFESAMEKEMPTVNEVSQVQKVSSSYLPSASPLAEILWENGRYYAFNEQPEDWFTDNPILNKKDMRRGRLDGKNAKKMFFWTTGKGGLRDYVKLIDYDPTTKTTTEHTFDKMIGLNRILRVTDRGLSDKLRESADIAKRENDKELVVFDDIKTEYVYRYLPYGDNMISKDELINEIAKEKFDAGIDNIEDQSTKDRIKDAAQDIRLKVIFGSDNPYSDVFNVIKTESNDVKIKVLNKYRDIIDDDTAYFELLDVFKEEKIISKEIYDELYK